MKGFAMRKYLSYLAAVCFISFLACNKTPELSQVILSPAQPKVGDTVKISYIPGKSSPLLTAENVLLMAQYYPNNSNNIYRKDIYLHEIPMGKSGKKWVTKIQIADTTGCVLLNFISGKEIDSNNKKGWDVIVYNEKNMPAKNTYTALARTYLHTMYLKRERNITTALNYLKKERMLYPDNWRALTDGWAYRFNKAKNNQEQQARLDSEVDSLVATFYDNPKVLAAAHFYFNLKHDDQKEASILKKLKIIDPQNSVILFDEWRKLRNLKDPEQQIKRAKEFLSQVKNTDLYPTIENWLASLMLDAKHWDDAVKYVNHLPDPSSQMLNEIAWTLFEANKKLLSAEKFSRKSVELSNTQSTRDKPSFMPLNKWNINISGSRNNSLDTYACIEHKLGKMTEAEKAFKEVYEFSKGGTPELTEHYLACLVDMNKDDKALTIAQKAIEENHANDVIVELFKKISLKKTGNTTEADRIIATAKKIETKKRKEEITTHFITDAKPAPAFVLKNLDGKEISLESLKGKTVVIDFWATWCGPCKSSFPYLQKFWEQHKNNPDVMVVAINCWEEKKGEERIKIIKKFMKDNNYTFPVLIDETNKAVTAYEVSGIPTKFFAGPDSKIYFKDVGFPGTTMVEDMNIELNLIKKKISK